MAEEESLSEKRKETLKILEENLSCQEKNYLREIFGLIEEQNKEFIRKLKEDFERDKGSLSSPLDRTEFTIHEIHRMIDKRARSSLV